MQKNGGYLSYKDLADDSSTWVEPVSTTYRGYRVWELPPNGQGITVLQMLNILEGFDFSKIRIWKRRAYSFVCRSKKTGL